MKTAGYITPAQLQVLQGFGGAGQVQLKVRTRADETHTVALAAIPADQVLVPRELLERVVAFTETLYDLEQRAKALDDLRALLQR